MKTLCNVQKAFRSIEKFRNQIDDEDKVESKQFESTAVEHKNLLNTMDESKTLFSIHKAHILITKFKKAVDDEVKGLDDIDSAMDDFSALVAKADRV